MSFLSEVQAAIGPRKLKGFDVAFYPDWASFWNACPLSRRMFARHREDGSEYLTPENDAQFYHDMFFQGDSFGLVMSKNGQPITGVVYRRTAPDTAEQTLRVGAPQGPSGIRAYLWDVGIRKITYKIHPTNTTTRQYMEDLERGKNNRHSKEDRADGYTHYTVDLDNRPGLPEDTP